MSDFDAIASAIQTVDLPALLAALRRLGPAQRHAQRAALLQLRQDLDAAHAAGGNAITQHKAQALAAALVVCGTAKDVPGSWITDEWLVALGQEFRPRALDGLADVLLAHSPQRIASVQALIAAGLSPRPDSPAYALGLIALPGVLRNEARLHAALAADPGLAAALLRVFEVEGTADTSLASSDKYNHQPGLMWDTILLGLVERGTTTPAELLDKTLSALQNDWPQYRSGWFSRFHARLAPDARAMQPHLSRYLALCHSRIAPTVSLALDALATIDAATPVAGGALLDALQPVLAGAVKGQVEAALKLAERAVQREPALGELAAQLAVPGLLIESAPLQKAILRRLATWGVDDAARGLLRGVGAAIAAVNQAAWAALVGDVAAPVAAVTHDAAPVAPARRIEPLDAQRRIAPIEAVQALVDCVAHVFENDTDVDAFEQALAGLVALAPFSAAQQRSLAPVLKRAAKVRKPLPMMLARLLLALAEGRDIALVPSIDGGGHASPVQALLIGRIDALLALARCGAGVVPLSTPTHRGGFIAPQTMVERVALHQAHAVPGTLGEQVLGLLRLAPGADDATRAAARRLADTPFARALRHALGDSVELGPEHALYAAAARIRHPGADDEALLRHQGDLGPDAARAARHAWHVHSWDSRHGDQTYHFHDLVVQTAAVPPAAPPECWAVQRHPPEFDTREFHTRWWRFGGVDEASVCWSATLLPSCQQTFFAEGARAIGNNLDWWEAQWHNAAYLRALLEPTAALGSMGTLLLALGLLGKEAGQTAIAVDALVQSHADGRLDGAALGDTLRRLLCTPLPKAARLRASLLAALRAEAALRRPIFEITAAVVMAQPAPRELAGLLDLLLELKLSLGLPLPAATLKALDRGHLSGRALQLQKKLLA